MGDIIALRVQFKTHNLSYVKKWPTKLVLGDQLLSTNRTGQVLRTVPTTNTKDGKAYSAMYQIFQKAELRKAMISTCTFK